MLIKIPLDMNLAEKGTFVKQQFSSHLRRIRTNDESLNVNEIWIFEHVWDQLSGVPAKDGIVVVTEKSVDI